MLRKSCLLTLAACLMGWLFVASNQAQTEVTGALQGSVYDEANSRALANAEVEIVNEDTQRSVIVRTDSGGRFGKLGLAPGRYKICVNTAGFAPLVRRELLVVTQIRNTGLLNISPGQAVVSFSCAKAQPTETVAGGVSNDVNTSDARRSVSFDAGSITGLPLGGATFARSFDELALLTPGVAPPPATQGRVAGPGQGPGVGSAGQFAVNGLRSRGNNFTVDGSDNNDEDIGVRRQGFLALVTQPLESVREYQIISLLAPAQYGRNLGAQVNAVSASGGANTHGSLYNFTTSSRINPRNFFDGKLSEEFSLRAATNQPVLYAAQSNGLNPTAIKIRNESGDKDSLLFGILGGTVGGSLGRKTFFFLAAEGQLFNATQEENFAVPTVEQRGVANSGATGLFRDLFTNGNVQSAPTSITGDVIFSFYPFANNPNGVYGANTYTQVLPANGQSQAFSGKVTRDLSVFGFPSQLNARYSLSNENRIIPAAGEALFSSLDASVRAQNFAAFISTEVSANKFNQFRFSYGRTKLDFDEPSSGDPLPPANAGVPFSNGRRFQTSTPFRNASDSQLLLNVAVLQNTTRPAAPGAPNIGAVTYLYPGFTSEQFLGPVGQISIAGFSSVGADVFNFPQQRINSTFQSADTFTYLRGNHNFAFGFDARQSDTSIDQPRNNRPLLAFNGVPRIARDSNGVYRLARRDEPSAFLRPETLAALGAPSRASHTIAFGPASDVQVRYYQINFFGQDEWRIRPALSLSYGLRYEYNTPPKERSGVIEKTFADSQLTSVPGLTAYLQGRRELLVADKNNLAPRLGLAYAIRGKGEQRTVLRMGYGLYYDQILGAVVTQSRNVFPNFYTLDFAGGFGNPSHQATQIALFSPVFLVQNYCGRFNPVLNAPDAAARQACAGNSVFHNLAGAFNTIRANFLNISAIAPESDFVNSISATLPARDFETPLAHQYTIALEQQVGRELFVSLSYAGTQGKKLLRLATPNLGPNAVTVPLSFEANANLRVGGVTAVGPALRGFSVAPRPRLGAASLTGGRPVSGVGSVNIYESNAGSRYDSLQVQIHGRSTGNAVDYRIAYTFSKVTDDVSDVFDLAGASALPQDSLDLKAERGPANFDARHRFATYFTYDLPRFRKSGRVVRLAFGGLQVAGTAKAQSGQPFTVNSVFDVNLDGNLTDRLDNTNGLIVTGDSRQPLRLSSEAQRDTTSLLAPAGQNGRIGRNSFRAGNFLEVNLALAKSFFFKQSQGVTFRIDVFNVSNHANFGIPARILEAPGFGQATTTITPGRRLQVALKYLF